MSSPAAYIERAANRIRLAMEQWDAANPVRAGQCQRILEEAASDLRAAIALVIQTQPRNTNDIVAGVRTLRSDVTRLTGLVDACSAFHRELLLRLGASAPGYGASGEPIDEVPGSDRMLAG